MLCKAPCSLCVRTLRLLPSTMLHDTLMLLRHQTQYVEREAMPNSLASAIDRPERLFDPHGAPPNPRTLMTSPWSSSSGAPAGSSVSAHGRTTTAGTPLSRICSRSISTDQDNSSSGGSGRHRCTYSRCIWPRWSMSCCLCKHHPLLLPSGCITQNSSHAVQWLADLQHCPVETQLTTICHLASAETSAQHRIGTQPFGTLTS
jgi:hypothetical protein